ncbi:hypothetical protein P43SY_008105 [Pythium insidiosum]|uniref:Uncharacterized protein n=1 Tax=Pythium insidiosum TaxID=114742 RepID=A0AAD5LJ48_PYTIN|nr:hypothetical protein P43SY_008105 [Pythium insidiosum]
MLADSLVDQHHSHLWFPCVRRHPSRDVLVAQTNANQALFFRASAPFRRLRHWRPLSGSHETDGLAVRCSFSPSGDTVVSGDARGRVAWYALSSQRCVRQRQVLPPTTSALVAESHPVDPQQLLVAGSCGRLRLLNEQHRVAVDPNQ